MMKIGFVDYYLSEWHANNYPDWMHEAAEKKGLDIEISHAWAELDLSPMTGKTTAEWCEQFGVKPCGTIEELCELCDVIVVLAPSNPEKHLEYAKRVLPYKKPTYIDKTFTPNLAEAKEIFAIAEKYGTPFFSSSALRYATELDTLDGCRQIMTTGGGGSVGEYIVHQAEMVVKKLGVGAESVSAQAVGDQLIFTVSYPDDRSASMIYGKAYPFTAYMANAEKAVYKPISSDFFKLLIADMLEFFTSGARSFDPAETLEVMAIREMALRAAER